MEESKLCPNCGRSVPDGKTICPNCGAFLSPASSVLPVPNPAWPPPPGGTLPTPWPPTERLLTGRRGPDFWIGFLPPPALAVFCVVGVVRGTDWLTALSGVALLATLVLCAALQRRLPVVARGLSWGLIAIPLGCVLLFLGAFAVCLYAVFHRSS